MLGFINTYMLGGLTPLLLMSVGLFFTLRLKCFYLRHPIKMIKCMTERQRGDGISPFRAVTLALAGTLGVGNIVGVASAIAMGGCGAVFWMWISALLSMMLKYAEIVLAVSHRRLDGVTGQYYGGAMYYIRDFFAKHNKDMMGMIVAGIFAVFCLLNSLTMGCVVQINAITSSMRGVLGIEPAIIGGLLAVVCVIVIAKNAKQISSITEKTVPFMTVGFLFISIAALVMRADMIPDAFSRIFREAFDLESAAGGFFGFFFSRAVRFGSMRGLMSNEAGCGTAPIAHASSSTDCPAKQGLWGIFEVFVDTIVLCTVTALVIIISGEAYAGDPMMLTVRAYSSILGRWSEYFLCIAVLLFGFATMICWAHYGKECLRYFSQNKYLSWGFVLLFGACIFVGGISAPESVWDVADLALGVMTVINVPLLCLMRREIIDETERVFK